MKINQVNDKLPHTFEKAHAGLQTALKKAKRVYKRLSLLHSSRSVIKTIERFVDELKRTPAHFKELQRRASLVETACRAGGDYDRARNRALQTVPKVDQEHSKRISRGDRGANRGTLALFHLEKESSRGPILLAELQAIQYDLDAIYENPHFTIGTQSLPEQSLPAWMAWREAVRQVLLEADRLEVDGCWYLLHAYQGGSLGALERSETARHSLQQDIGGSHLDSLLAAADSLVAWIRESVDRRHPEKPLKRRWTQTDLDQAIRERKAKMGDAYKDMVDNAKRGLKGAKKKAQDLFGRNKLADALGVKSRDMITKSSVWREIAEELKLPRGKRQHLHRRRVGSDIGLEEAAQQAVGRTGLDEAILNETIQRIQKLLPKEAANEVIDKLQRGIMTLEDAEVILEAREQQKEEDRADRRRRKR